MTNEEKVKQIYDKTYEQCIEDDYPKKVALTCAIMSKMGAEIMVEWKDEQYAKVLAKLLVELDELKHQIKSLLP